MKKKIRSSNLKGKRVHGFRARKKTSGGRKVLSRQRKSVKAKPFRSRKTKVA